MVKRNKWVMLLVLLSGTFLCGTGALVLAQEADMDYLAAASNYLQAVQNGWGQAQQLCQTGDCDPGFSDELSSLGGYVDYLNGLLQQIPPDLNAVKAAIATMSPLAQDVCNQVGGQCNAPLGAETPAIEEVSESDKTPGAAAPGCTRCTNLYRTCTTPAINIRNSCVQNANRLLNCQQRVPFCDWPGFPFDAAAYTRDCQDFINAGLLPNCRCQCPQSERQGGCPTFFQTGAMCSDCSSGACARGGDPRCSCQQQGGTVANWNSVQCDLCRWSNVGVALGELRRTLLCEGPYERRIDICGRRLAECDCYP